MRRSKVAALAAAVLGMGLATTLDAAAQPKSEPAPQPRPARIPDEVVLKIVRLGLENIERASCGGLEPCAPATPDEMKYPPVTVAQARVAVMVGTRTALANWCGLDGHRRSVLPMRRQLSKMPLNNRQMALLAVVHSIQHSVAASQLKARGTCDAKTRAKLDAQLPKTPGSG